MERIAQEWRGNVYRLSSVDYDYWNRVRDVVIERDGLRCQACRKKKLRKNLTVHHILPRADGGTEDLDNLITLCGPCHDYVEETNFRTWREIKGCTQYVDWREEDRKKGEAIEEVLQRVDQARPDWHESVYGCRKKRRKH